MLRSMSLTSAWISAAMLPLLSAVGVMSSRMPNFLNSTEDWLCVTMTIGISPPATNCAFSPLAQTSRGWLSTRTAPLSNRAPAEKSVAAEALTLTLADLCVCPESRPAMGWMMETLAVAPSPVDTSAAGGLIPTALLLPVLASTKSTSTRIILFMPTVTRFSAFSAAARAIRSSLRRSSFDSTEPSSTSVFPRTPADTPRNPCRCSVRFSASAASLRAFPLGRTKDVTCG